MIMRLVRFMEKVPVIGWLIRTAEWVWEGIGYLLDERKDRQRYGKPIRFWMVWKKLGRQLNLSIREGGEREKNRRGGKRWGWVRGVRWVDRGVRGPEDRREMWLHSGDKVEFIEQDENKGQEDEFWVGGMQRDGREDTGGETRSALSMEKISQEEIAEADRRVQAVRSRYQEEYKEFMEGYGQRRKVMPVVPRGIGKTAAAKRTKQIMELHEIKVKEVGKTYGKRLG